MLLGTLLVLSSWRGATAQKEVEYVGTPMDFQAAVEAGVRHIIIKSHLDLRALSADSTSTTNSTVIIKASTQSMRVWHPARFRHRQSLSVTK